MSSKFAGREVILDDVSVRFRPDRELQVVALHNVSVRLVDNQLTGIIGANGSGKTTLLRVLARELNLRKSDNAGGTYEVRPISSELRLAYVESDPMLSLVPDLNVIENFVLRRNLNSGNSLGRAVTRADRVDFTQACERHGLSSLGERVDASVYDLSGGQRQLLVILGCLGAAPDLFLLDEPTSKLDSHTASQLWDVLSRTKIGRMIVVASHDQERVRAIADQVIELRDGKVVGE